MGLLDSLLYNQSGYGGQGGGLLDLLQNSMMQQNNYQPSTGFPQQLPGRSFDSATFDPATYAPTQPSNGIAVGGYQMPRIGAPEQFQPQQAMTPPNAQPTQGQLPQQAQQQAPQQPEQLPPALGGSGSGFSLGNLGRAFNPDGLIARLTGNDSRSISQQNLNAQYQAVRQTLQQSGMSAQEASSKAMLAVMNPEAGKTILNEALTNKEKYIKIGQDQLGRETYGFVNERDQTINGKPVSQQAASNSGGLGNMDLTGQAYLATVPKEQAGIIQGMVDGTIQPPSSFALAKPYWQAMLAAAKNVDPNFDANTWATRHKLSTDMAASGNSSMGGILANGKSAFSHLADLSGSMADLGNTSHDFPGGGTAAAVQNYLGNKTFAGSDTLAKIKAINDNLGHYGQESTKFYSGTGGGVEERMNALKEMNPTTTSSEEMASYLAKEKSLMMDRLKQKEAQIRDTMGDGYLKKHPILTSDLQQTLDTIDTNIEKLKGATKQPNSPSLPSGWSVQVR